METRVPSADGSREKAGSNPAFKSRPRGAASLFSLLARTMNLAVAMVEEKLRLPLYENSAFNERRRLSVRQFIPDDGLSAAGETTAFFVPTDLPEDPFLAKG
jgi:hypothetical protein